MRRQAKAAVIWFSPLSVILMNGPAVGGWLTCARTSRIFVEHIKRTPDIFFERTPDIIFEHTPDILMRWTSPRYFHVWHRLMRWTPRSLISHRESGSVKLFSRLSLKITKLIGNI
jgi:hypothetical protein